MAKKNGKWLIPVAALAIGLLGYVASVLKSYYVLPTVVAHQAKDFKDFAEKDFVEMKDANNKDHGQYEDDIAFQDDRLYETEKEVYGIKKDISSLTVKVDRNFKEQHDFQVEQRITQKAILDKIGELQK